jgi:hypothetical protein
MDQLEHVREIESAPDAAATARIARARGRVMSEVSTSARRRHRMRWVWGGTATVGGLSAAAIAATVILAGAVAPVVSQPASAAAAEVVSEAAEMVVTGTDPALQPGQYLRVRETYELVALWDADAGDGTDPIAGFNMASFLTAEGAVLQRGVRDLYVPAERSGDWVQDDRAVNDVVQVWGDPRTADAFAGLVAAAPARDADPDGLTVLPGGAYQRMPQETPPPGSTAAAPQGEEEFYDLFRPFYGEMPRDPQQLLGWYRDHLQTSSDDWYVFQAIGRLLGTDLMPADLRAASLRVLGLLGNVDVAGTNGTVTTLAMTTQFTEETEFGDQLVSELDIDTSTGRIVGIREGYPHRSTSLMPAGVPWASWSIEVSIVDSAPMP